MELNEKQKQEFHQIRLNKEFINQLPLRSYEGSIVIVDSDEKVPGAIATLEQERVLGFDTESRPTFKKGQSFPPSLLQLGSSEAVYLFQLNKLNNCQPIQRLLGRSDTSKVGIAVHDDIRKLQELMEFEALSFIDLSKFTRQRGIVNTGLRNLVALFLGFRISKAAQVTNWSHSQLTESQIKYAATDAWVSLLLYRHLEELGWILSCND